MSFPCALMQWLLTLSLLSSSTFAFRMRSGSRLNSSKGASYASVPVKFVVITKKDGTGHVEKRTLEDRMVALNTYYAGQDPNTVDEKEARRVAALPSTTDTCGRKCDLALCFDGGKYKDLISIKDCWCEDDYCKKWSGFNGFQGPLTDSGISFAMQSVDYVVNDVWHEQCCCTWADVGYDVKQNEIFDAVIDKETVRSVVTVIVCDMKDTAGQSLITGTASCEGGPGLMLTTEFGAGTFSHEFGHYFGLYHTFNEDCPKGSGDLGMCADAEVCDPKKNLGDRVDDTPIHRKQGQCNIDANSCPNLPGKDPMDNIMSYSGCNSLRFTPMQVERLRKTISDYYPAMLVQKHGEQPKDLPCNPRFPSGVVPPGYAPPADDDHDHGHGAPVCNLEEGQCDTHETTGCFCHDSSICCAGFGCAGTDGSKMCLPCEWSEFDNTFTPDSCRKGSLAEMTMNETTKSA